VIIRRQDFGFGLGPGGVFLFMEAFGGMIFPVASIGTRIRLHWPCRGR
jgi:hypothetical protein